MTSSHPASPFRVAVIDNKDDVLYGMRAMLEEQGYDVELFYSTEDFLGSADPKDFICIFLDYLLGRNRANGLEYLKENPDVSRATSVVMMTEFADIPSSFQSAKLGVMAYLPKPILTSQLSELLKQAKEKPMQLLPKSEPTEKEPQSVGRQRLFDRVESFTSLEEWCRLIDQAQEKLSPEIVRQLMSLELREVQVFAKIAARGLTNKKIGKELHLSDRTIETHYNSLKDKLQLKESDVRAATLKLRDILLELIEATSKSE